MLVPGRGDRPVPLIDALLHIREEVERGRPIWMFTGTASVDALLAFTAGYALCCTYNAIDNSMYGEFCDWLRDVRAKFPAEGWHRKLLEESRGDHDEAIRKFLNLVHEFAASKPR